MSDERKINRKKLSEEVDPEKLIKLIKEYKTIYHHSFSKVGCPEKDRAWKSIAKKLGCKVESAKLKWTYLRDSYKSFLKRKKEVKKAKQKKPKKTKVWRHAEAMEFVKPHVTNEETDSTDDELAYNEKIKDFNSTSKSKTKKPTFTQMERCDSSDDEEISDKDEEPNAEEDDSTDDDPNEDDLDKSFKDKQHKSTTSNSNQTAMSSTICTTRGLDAEDIVFLGYSKTIKKFPPIEKSRAIFRVAGLITRMETKIIEASSQAIK